MAFDGCTEMRRSTLLFVAASLVVAAGVGVGGTGLAAADETDVSISDVRVVPDDPAPRESFTVTANVSNLDTSSGPIQVEDVYLREHGEPTEYARAQDLGSVGAGNSITVQVTGSIDRPGTKNLRLHAYVQTSDGEYRTLKRPVRLDVEHQQDVLVSVPTTEASADYTNPINVTVANGDESAISSVRLTLDGEATVANPERVTASIDSGVDETFQFDVNFEEEGTKSLDATLEYATADGATRTVTESAAIDVSSGTGGDGIEGRIRLTGVEASGSGVVTLQGDAANVGGTNVESVLLSVDDTESVTPMGSSGEYFVGPVNASDFDTFELTAQVDDGTTSVPVRMEYIVGGEKRTEVVSVDASASGGAARDGFERDREFRRQNTPSRDHGSRSGGLPGPGLFVVPLVVVGLPVGYYLLKRR